jgi:NAD(P)-dependent dehydrogenase (short-subunit alcohol dehydrogenase family)
MKIFKGKVTLITGGGKGIGFGLATAFAREGSNLVITGRNMERLNSAKERLEKEWNVEVLPIVADGADEAAVKMVVREAYNKFGRIDTLINNAQASKSGLPLIEHSREDFDLAILSGIYGAFFYMRECFPYLKQTKGSVINFASGAGLFGRPGQSSYAAAKEGIRGLSRVAATEWGPSGVRVNVVCPLAMTEQLQHWKGEYPELFEKTIRDIPMGRFADPTEDIGKACVFLASDDASYITGETISLQGGSGLRP